MPFPASLTTRTVKGRFLTYPDGAAAKGTVKIVLADWMQGPTDDAFVAPFEAKATLDSTGSFALVVPTTDDPQWTHVSYQVTITASGKTLRGELHVPYNETGPIDLADVLNVPAPVPGQAYIVASARGAPGGVASLDSTGKVPSSQVPSVPAVAAWADVTGKPATFPHDPITWTEIVGKPDIGDNGPVDWTDLENVPATFPPSRHTHTTSDVTDLDTALAGKADTSALSGYATTTALTTGLAGKANSTHTHVQADVTGLATALSAKADTTALTTGLAGKANTSHTHGTSDVTGLDTTLAAKASASHTHTAAQVTDLASLLAGKADASAVGAKVIVLDATEEVPSGTAPGTVIIRRSS